MNSAELQQAISDLAHRLWEERGRRDGHADDDWCDAERHIEAAQAALTSSHLSSAVDESLRETFPASDAAASHLPDERPSNADAKWAAYRRGS